MSLCLCVKQIWQVGSLEKEEQRYERLEKFEGIYDWLPPLGGRCREPVRSLSSACLTPRLRPPHKISKGPGLGSRVKPCALKDEAAGLSLARIGAGFAQLVGQEHEAFSDQEPEHPLLDRGCPNCRVLLPGVLSKFQKCITPWPHVWCLAGTTGMLLCRLVSQLNFSCERT